MALTLFPSREHTFQQFSALPAQVWNSKRHAKSLYTDPDLKSADRITEKFSCLLKNNEIMYFIKILIFFYVFHVHSWYSVRVLIKTLS